MGAPNSIRKHWMSEPFVGRGQNSVQLRRHHERVVLQTLRRGGELSKADLARKTNLTSTSIGTIIQALEASKLVEYSGRKSEGRGQPAALYRLNPKGTFGIGVRLDRDSIETALVDFGGKILARCVHDCILPSPTETLELVQNDINEVLKILRPDERKSLTGIGVALPFHLGAWLDRLLLKPEFHAWDDVDFAFELGQATGHSVFGENDGNAATIAELFYGRGREFDDFLYIFLGPVIGCGVAIDGDCLRGITGNAGDIAIMPVPPSQLASVPKPPGKWDILLSRASLNALSRHLQYCGETVTTHLDLARFIEARHPAVDAWLDDCVDALTPIVQGAVSLLDTPLLIIDADVDAGLVELLMNKLAENLNQSAPETWRTPTLIRGSFGSDAGAIGAASLPMFFNFSPR